MNENQKIPRIRFKGFTDTWEQRKAKELFEDVSEKGFPYLPVLSATQDMGMVKRDDTGKQVFHDKRNEEGYKRVLPGQYVIHLRSFQGGFAHSSIEGITSPAYTVFRHKTPEKHYDLFWKYIFSSKQFIRRLESVTYGIRDGRSISYEEFLTMSFAYPSFREQEEIASALIQVDNLITLHQRKYDKLVATKKALLEKMFPRDGATVPEIRFKGFTDAWEQRKLGKCLEVSVEKNNENIYGIEDVLSVSGDYGVVNQIEFQGRSFAGASVSNYGVVHTGNVVYTKSPLKSNPYGIIKTNKGKTGIVSVLYGIYSVADDICPDLIQTYFEQDARLNNYLRPLVNKGAKNTLLVSDEDALQGDVVLPLSYDEQLKIKEIFDSIDNLITLHQRKLEKLKNIKKSLLEKMFV